MHKLHSKVLNEERSIQVYLPEGYDAPMDTMNRYSVMYLLDGDLYFHSITGLQKALSSGRTPLISKCIVVGIVSKNRAYDFTPIASAYGRDGKRSKNQPIVGGNAQNFSSFLQTELRNFVDSLYRSNGHNILWGHSLGGLFVIHALLTDARWFDTYIALDPSLWWDNAFLLSKHDSLMSKTPRFFGKKLYVAVAGKTRAENGSIHRPVMLQFFEKNLPLYQKYGLFYKTQIFPDDDHGSIILPSSIAAFRNLGKRP
ncbi:MAG: alpha/beta hydrolase [Bacteroidales bacterium]